MSAGALLSELRSLDIRVWLEGDTLRCNAPAGRLTESLRERLRASRNELLNFLRGAHELASQPRAIVPLEPHGTKIPVFAVPGHNGDVFCYRALAQALGEEQPFFGLQPPGLDGSREPLVRVEELAAYFAEQVRAFHPRGRLIVAGFCAGGTVAFELAQQLGGDAEFVALFGAPYPSFYRPLGQLGHQLGLRTAALRRNARLLTEQPAGDALRHLVGKIRPRATAPQAAPLDAVTALRGKVERATLSAVRAYRPRPYAGCVHLFVPSRAWARWSVGAERWRGVAPHGETAFGPDGCGNDNMLLPGNAPAFAALFRRASESARGPLGGAAQAVFSCS